MGSKVDVAAILRAGGIAPPGSKLPASERAGAVSARAYRHAALLDRVVVRLSTDAVAPGIDVEMETLGFGAPLVTGAVGFERYRALGFPGWALVHDPARAKFALEVMKDFKKAAARAKSKPGHARDAFVAIGDRLARSVPHFLPSFWEEAGRAFLAEGNGSYAAQSFEKARQMENEHGLAIDEEVRGAVFLEFALGGAVNVKSLSAYAKVLVTAYGAKDGYARFIELARRRTLGGMPPWSGMAKELRALAKSAGLDPDAEDDRFLGEVLSSNALTSAPAEFWSSYRPALIRIAKRSADVRDRLRRLFPKPPNLTNSDPFATTWIELLREAGALDAVVAMSGEEAKREAHGMAADWLGKLLAFAHRESITGSLVETMAPRLIAEGALVAIAHGSWWRGMNVDVVETALGLGVPIEAPGPKDKFNLDRDFQCDPVHVMADERFKTKLAEAVGDAMGKAAFEARAVGKVGLVAARRAWIEERVDAAQGSTLAILDEALTAIAKRTTPATFTEFTDLRDRFASIDARKNLACTLRGGLFDEFGWPAFEEAATALGASSTSTGYFPYAVIHNATRAIVIGAKGPILEHDLAIPPKSRLHEIFFVPSGPYAGQLLVQYYDAVQSTNCGYWSDSPNDRFALERRPFDAFPTTLPQGGLSFGGRPLMPGDTRVDYTSHGAISDGTTFWAVDYERDPRRVVLREFDPATGTKGRVSWPSAIEETIGPGMHVSGLWLEPAPDALQSSPLGMKDRLLGRWNLADASFTKRAVFGVDGRTQTNVNAFTLVRWPGDDLLRGVIPTARTVGLVDPRGQKLGTIGDTWSHQGWKVPPNVRFWDFLSPRDPQGSAALRRISDETAGKLIEAAREDRAQTGTTPNTTRLIGELLPEVTHDKLRAGILGVVVRAASLAETLKSAIARYAGDNSENASATTGAPLDDETVRTALQSYVAASYTNDHFSRHFEEVSRALERGIATDAASSGVQWERWIGRVRGMAVHAAGLDLKEEYRSVALRVLELWQATIFAREADRTRFVVGTIADKGPFIQKNGDRPKACWVTNAGPSRYFVRVTNLSMSLTPGTPRSAHLVEYATDGTFRVPAGFTMESEIRATTKDDAWLGAFLHEFKARGAPPWEPRFAEDLSRRTGLTRAEGILLSAGLPGSRAFGLHLETDVRAKLDLKAAEAKVAGATFTALSPTERLALFTAAASDDARAFWDPLQGESGAIARLASAWVARAGKSVTLREDVIVACEKAIDTPHPASRLLAALVDPANAAILKPAKTSSFEDVFASQKSPSPANFTPSVVESVALLIPHLFISLPVGDPYRNALPDLLDAVLARLRDPKTLLPLFNTYDDAKRNQAFFDGLGGEPTVIPNTLAACDTGIIVAALGPHEHTRRAAFRPANVKSFGDATLLWKLGAPAAYSPMKALISSAFLVDFAPVIIERIRTTPLSPGTYEANPALSAADVVKKIRARTKLSAEAATLYAQVLALAEPTAKNVQLWNAWSTKDYAAARDELAATKLVVTGKRERAGRDIFLPGAWSKMGGFDLPVETWKKKHYALPYASPERMLAPKPLHAIFEAAWARVIAGDEPAFEEV